MRFGLPKKSQRPSRYLVEPRRRGCLGTRGSGTTSGRGTRGGLGGFCVPRGAACARERRGAVAHGAEASWRAGVLGSRRRFRVEHNGRFLKPVLATALKHFDKTAAKKAHTARCRGCTGARDGLTAKRATASPRNRVCGNARIHQRPIWQNAVWAKKTAPTPRQCIIPTGSRSPVQGRAAESKFRAPAAQKLKHRASVAGPHDSRGIDTE